MCVIWPILTLSSKRLVRWQVFEASLLWREMVYMLLSTEEWPFWALRDALLPCLVKLTAEVVKLA